MHDLDRTQLETDAGEFDGEIFGEDELAGGDGELDEILQEAGVEEASAFSSFESGDNEMGLLEVDSAMEAGDGEGETDGEMLNEVEEIQLASELLEITNEEELDQFIGKLLKRAWRGVRRVGRGLVRPLGKVLKVVARKALPILGGAAGTFFGGPLGGAIGSKLASGAGRVFGLELGGMSSEDQQFEVARRFVRFATSAARQAARTPSADPRTAVRAAVRASARQYAPGLIVRTAGAPSMSPALRPRPRRGIWVRRGRTITLLGV